ncbi:hypothetical protein PGT21_036511 [Puccinia graminis f. sp. tritici]|uniref:Uncharacterized protein n=1 Tax=Puccinia graminis f. sp. tritici TaxID=56615 RepID=A0A5B0Q072_PUCGR|nr:hypothetical protein PGT21_036511 [Puccinia graminis f. sp. tritici]KAA1126201.1 hypothetical protein PGTUg99_012256 [Puccinia graminis f. sp. tritici]
MWSTSTRDERAAPSKKDQEDLGQVEAARGRKGPAGRLVWPRHVSIIIPLLGSLPTDKY